MQHAWATAVEIADLFTGQRLKSGQGDPHWLRFFALMGSAIARNEGGALVPDTPSDLTELQSELSYYGDLLQVREKMLTFASFRTELPEYSGVSGYSGFSGESGYFVMELDRETKEAQVRGYRQHEIERAAEDIARTERKNPNSVLVAAADLERLQEAYPNWIGGTFNFVGMLDYTLNPHMLL